jgi:hypothetical protein
VCERESERDSLSLFFFSLPLFIYSLFTLTWRFQAAPVGVSEIPSSAGLHLLSFYSYHAIMDFLLCVLSCFVVILAAHNSSLRFAGCYFLFVRHVDVFNFI